jgi:hypothetical protein
MNVERFESLSKSLGASTSRRGLLKAFVAGLGATALGLGRTARRAGAQILGGTYPTTFQKGMCYEAFPTPYSPSSANGNASVTCGSGVGKDGTGLYEFFGSDALRRESAPMWDTSYTTASGTTVTGRNDLGKMIAMGANMVRPYDWDARDDHFEFLQRCQANGVKVLAAVSNYYTLYGYPGSLTQMQPLVRSFGNNANPALATDYHPAVAGIIIGNEPAINGYDNTSAGPVQTVAVTNAYLAAEAAVGFPSRPMIGHPVDFTPYDEYGNPTGLQSPAPPCWKFFDALLSQLVKAPIPVLNRIFLAPQTYNPASYLYVQGTEPNLNGMGWVPATFARYQAAYPQTGYLGKGGFPILFTEIGQSRVGQLPNPASVIQAQLSTSISWAAQNPGVVLGTTFFEYGDKVWLCPTGDPCSQSEGTFGAWSHQNPYTSTLSTVPYVCNPQVCDFNSPNYPAHFDFDPACASQTVTYDVLTQSSLYSAVVAGYSGGGGMCGGQGQTCCTTSPQCNNAALGCYGGICSCGGQNQVCCAGNTCSGGFTCSNNMCIPSTCGGSGEVCCATTPNCEPGLTCTSGKCQPAMNCGAVGQQCCMNNTCNNGLVCVANVCTAQSMCGGLNQMCCNGNTCNDASLICQNGTCISNSMQCGAPGQPCCSGSACNVVAGTVCFNGTCQYCGLPGQACCANNTCNNTNGLMNTCCSTQGSCPSAFQVGTCQACGLPGQPCCGGPNGTCQKGTCGQYSTKGPGYC